MGLLARLGLLVGLLFSQGGTFSPAWAQLILEHDRKSLGALHKRGAAAPYQDSTSGTFRSFPPDQDATRVFKQILAVSGLAGIEDRIVIRASAEVANAEAFVEDQKRIILYRTEFMQELVKNTKNCWSQIAVLAHEVGHHLRFHTVVVGRDQEFELEADYSAGFILRRLGATLEQTQAAFRELGQDVASSSYPVRAQRVEAASSGWASTKPDGTQVLLCPASTDTGIRVDFSAAGREGQAPRYVVVAGPYLRTGAMAITIEQREPPASRVVLVNNLGLYEGQAVAPTVSQNFLTQTDTNNVPASFTLRFSRPLKSVSFLVPKVWPATQSGITFPGWQATALGSGGEVLGSVSEGLTRRFADVPARTHTLRAPAFDGITAVRFESDPNLNGRPFAAFSAILIEELVLEPQ